MRYDHGKRLIRVRRHINVLRHSSNTRHSRSCDITSFGASRRRRWEDAQNQLDQIDTCQDYQLMIMDFMRKGCGKIQVVKGQSCEERKIIG